MKSFRSNWKTPQKKLSYQLNYQLMLFCFVWFGYWILETRLLDLVSFTRKVLSNFKTCTLNCLKILTRVLHFFTLLILFGYFFLCTNMALLGPSTRLFIFGKSSHLHCFLCNKYQKIPTYTPLLPSTRLLISEKTSHLHRY